ncbi:hypothetical protein [Hymenobacter nivis]|uniref:PhnA-like protein n=1 Tax=Hymenobacter nivis TaxID=1850093 RepID=A0A502GL76_9BACT|nr:hypothetical protein [Hymenobacter nivis]TPG63057.1 hypothetical protein EAH73_18555 [Hymenobacter nivis]
MNPDYPTQLAPAYAAPHKRISWGAVFAGALLALVTQLGLGLLGAGIGLSTIDPMQEQNPVSGLGTGAIIWYGISTLVALYVGGMVAGRLAGAPRRVDGLLHGLLSWGLVTLFTFYLLTTAVGGIISGVGGVAGRALTAAGSGIAAVAPRAGEAIKGELKEQGIDLNDVKREARELLNQTGKAELQPGALEGQARSAGRTAKAEAEQSASNPEGAGDNFDQLIDNLTSKAENIGNAADRDAAVNVVMKRTGKTRAESEQIVDNWISTAKQAQAKLKEAKDAAALKAREAGDAAASGLSKAAIFAFIGMVLGAAAAGFGGRQATPDERLVVRA